MINPPKAKSLFLLDAFGALVSAIMLGIVLVRFQPLVGIPVSTLYLLAALPCGFALYDLYCYFGNPIHDAKGLKKIAFVNMGYCGLSLALALFHFNVITGWGWAYIVGEVIIVFALARYELRVGKEINKSNNIKEQFEQNEVVQKSAINQDWVELISTYKWLIKNSDHVELGTEQKGALLSDQFQSTFPKLSQLITNARVLNLTINEQPYRLYGWTTLNDIRCGWINKIELALNPNLNIIPEHKLLLNEIGGIWESFNQPEPSLTLNQEYLFISSECTNGIGGWDDYYRLVCEQDNYSKIDFADFVCFVKEANGDVTLYDPKSGNVMLFAHDHCYKNVTTVKNQAEMTFYTIDGVTTFVDYVEKLAQEWLDHID